MKKYLFILLAVLAVVLWINLIPSNTVDGCSPGNEEIDTSTTKLDTTCEKELDTIK